MNTNNTLESIKVEFLPETESAVAVKHTDPINQVKADVYARYQKLMGANEHLLRLALFEADSLAQQTGFARLFFPQLAVEKAENVARWQSRQHFLLRSNTHYALAA
ncbi:MAG TPA: hypothetical protein VK742_13050 [Candidatus Sulfotelmatobacter sp.]|jgi:hypothetical protein|nr:hypothetical protein [Candidatus Sulfotelmatobacter sp.]